MTVNTLRTLLMIFGVILVPLASMLGCTLDDVTGAANCSASWIPSPYNLFLAPAVGVLVMILKATSQGGTLKDNLFNKTVAVVPADDAGVGTVTATQVSASK